MLSISVDYRVAADVKGKVYERFSLRFSLGVTRMDRIRNEQNREDGRGLTFWRESKKD